MNIRLEKNPQKKRRSSNGALMATWTKEERYEYFKKQVDALGWKLSSSPKSFFNQRKHVLIECPNGHTVRMLPYDFLKGAKPSEIVKIKPRGSGCPTCSGRNKSIEELKEFASKRGWKCLSDTYTRQKDFFLWECPNGHQKQITYHYFQKAQSCEKCNEAKLTIHDFMELANQNRGDVLSEPDKIYSMASLLTFKCSRGHIFRTNFSTAKKYWCPHCYS